MIYRAMETQKEIVDPPVELRQLLFQIRINGILTEHIRLNFTTCE